MGVLQDFERRLEGAVEGFFARAFRSGLQPVELAKAVQRYAEDQRLVAEDGVVVPNVFRLRISERDGERLSTYGDRLGAELAAVVERSADERGWLLRGSAEVTVEPTPDVRAGRYEIVGRVERGERPGSAPTSAPASADAEEPAPEPVAPEPVAPAPVDPGLDRLREPAAASARAATPDAGVIAPGRHARLEGDGATLTLHGPRVTVGRAPTCDLVLDEPTVSREHAALVHRGDGWWVLDLGSTNGTRVNGIQAAEQPLADGAEVAFGDATLRYREG